MRIQEFVEISQFLIGYSGIRFVAFTRFEPLFPSHENLRILFYFFTNSGMALQKVFQIGMLIYVVLIID